MPWKGLKHTNVGEGIETLEEWMGEDIHELDNGTTLPESPNEGDLFFKTDEHRLYINIEEV